MGANMEMIGRITISTAHVGGTLPNNGFVNTVINGIARDTYKNCYKYSFMLSTCANFAATITGIIIMSIMGTFA